MTTVYISGPMTGIPSFNFPMFDAVAEAARQRGWVAISPADHDRDLLWRAHAKGPGDFPGYGDGDVKVWSDFTGFNYHEALAWDLQQVIQADGIVMLPSWQGSNGARHERYVAEALGKTVYLCAKGESEPWTIYEDPEQTRLTSLMTHWHTPVSPVTYPKVIGLAGYAQSGKDTIGQHLVENHGYTRLAFADALKAVLADMNAICEVMLLGSGSDAIPPRSSLGRVGDVVQEQGWEIAKRVTEVRELLQRLGVAAREHIGPDVWVDAVRRKIAARPDLRYVITDVRFPNESELIWALKGELWRVERPGTTPVNTHVSETALDHVEADVYIENNGTVSELGDKIDSIFTGVGVVR